MPSIERDNSPAPFLLCFPIHVAGSCRAPKFLVAAGSGSWSLLMLQSGGLEFRAAPTAWGCRARTTRPTGHDTVTLCLYSAKGQCSLSVFARTTRSAGECRESPRETPGIGGERAPDNPPQPVPGRGSPRTTFPSPVKGRNRGSLQQDTRSLALLSDRRLLGGEGIKKPEIMKHPK